MTVFFKNDFFITKTLRFGFVAGENNVSPVTSRKKCYKCKVLSTDLLCVVGIDYNHCAEKRHGKSMLVVI